MSEITLYAKVPEWVIYHPKLKPIDLKVYAHLARVTGNRGYWTISRAELAEGLGISIETLKRSLRALSDKGVKAIRVDHRPGPHGQGFSRYVVAFTAPGAFPLREPSVQGVGVTDDPHLRLVGVTDDPRNQRVPRELESPPTGSPGGERGVLSDVASLAKEKCPTFPRAYEDALRALRYVLDVHAFEVADIEDELHEVMSKMEKNAIPTPSYAAVQLSGLLADLRGNEGWDDHFLEIVPHLGDPNTWKQRKAG